MGSAVLTVDALGGVRVRCQREAARIGLAGHRRTDQRRLVGTGVREGKTGESESRSDDEH